MPINNVRSKDLNKIRFKWCSFHTVFSICGLLGCSYEFALFMRSAFGPNFNFNVFSGFVYFISLLTTLYTCFYKSMQWNVLMQFWTERESIFLKRPYQHLKYKSKLKLLGSIIFLVTVGENFLNIGVNNFVTYNKTKNCDLNATYGEIYYYYFKRHYFEVHHYNIMLVIYSQAIDMISTVNRSMVDVLIISFSIAITSYFEILNKRISDYRREETSETFWISVRQHYLQITQLVRYIDHEFRIIVVVSCFGNLYFLCARLYACFGYFPSLFTALSFWFTVVSLVGRVTAVLFLAASVNEVSTEAINIVRQIPPSSWSTEVHRFMEQLLHECVAFSGNRFFFITRRSIFTMAGTIITFEIVLVHQLKRSPNIESTCDFEI